MSRATKIYLGDAQGRAGEDLRADGAQAKIYLGLSGAESGERHNGNARSNASSTKAFLSVGAAKNDLPAVGRQAAFGPLRLLLSYHYYKDENIEELLRSCFDGLEVDVFADSGAFSAMTLGKPVKEEDYIAWVEKWQHCFSVACGPDVIGNPSATHAATVRMKQRITSIPVLPTFHVGEGWSWLDRAVDLSDYIALGGMVLFARDRRLLAGWCQGAFKRIPELTRVHGFGMTNLELMKRFPWFSVDSSSWTAGFRYAQLQLFDVRRERMTEIRMGDPRDLLRHASLLESYGLRPSGAQASGYDRDLVCAAAVRSWQRIEAWLGARKVGKVYLSAGSINPGPNAKQASGHCRSIAAAIKAKP